jgi:shikimate dehydrogenase
MKTFGLIGKKLGHSFSKKFFTEFFEANNLIDCEYQNFELTDLALEIPPLKKMSSLTGLNVTIPYKKAIIPFLDGMTADCMEINACNCIEIKNGKWTGHNTDVFGFEKSFTSVLKPVHKKALILGDGGAAGAVKFVLEKLRIPFITVSRKKHDSAVYLGYQDLSPELFREYQIIINTTPLGMFPNISEAPDIPYRFISNSHYLYDLIYNPSKTLFLSKGEERGAVIKNGSDMLVLQAEESWRIWNA